MKDIGKIRDVLEHYRSNIRNYRKHIGKVYEHIGQLYEQLQEKPDMRPDRTGSGGGRANIPDMSRKC